MVEDIVARVNDQIITQSDYDRAAEQLRCRGEAAGRSSPQEMEQKQADLLRDLIDQQLLLSKGKELGITGETELIKELDDIRKAKPPRFDGGSGEGGAAAGGLL